MVSSLPSFFLPFGYRFFVFDNETDARPVVGIEKSEGVYARMLLEPMMLLYASGFNRNELQELAVLVREHKAILLKGMNAKK